MNLYENIKSSLKESEEGIRKKQLINNIEALLYSYDNGINDGYEEPFKSDEEMVDYVYRQVFDLKDDGTGFTKWADGICDDLKYLGKDYIINEIKRIGHEIGVVQMKESEEIKNNLKEFQSLKEWDSSKILDAAFKASDYYGEDPDWNDVIDTIIDKMPRSKFKEYLKNNDMTEEEFYDGLEFADYDSVISGLENYLSEKDIKDILNKFKIDDKEDIKQDKNKLSKKEVLKIVKDKVDDLVSQNKMIKEDNDYFYIGKADYFKGLKYDEEILKTLIRHFDNDVVKPLKKSGINIRKSTSRNDYGSYDIDYYTDDDSLSIGLGTLTSDDFDNLLDKETYYAEDIPYIGIK